MTVAAPILIVVLAHFAVVDALHRGRLRAAAERVAPGGAFPLAQVVALVGYPLVLFGCLEGVPQWTPWVCAGLHLVDLGIAPARGARPGLALLRIAVVAGALLAVAGGAEFEVQPFASGLHPPSITPRIAAVPALAGYVAAFALVIGAGQDLVRAVLEATHALPAVPDDRHALLGANPPMGRAIGVLERLILVTFVLVGAWAGIGMIVAAKSIARFRELEQRAFAEYYLVGTLASVFVALVVGGLVRALLGGGLVEGALP